MISYCEYHQDISLLAYSTLLSGLYSDHKAELPDGYDTKDNEIRINTLEKMAQSMGCTKNQIVLAWIMAHPVNIIPIISGSSIAQINECIGACQLNLTPAQIEELNSAGD